MNIKNNANKNTIRQPKTVYLPNWLNSPDISLANTMITAGDMRIAIRDHRETCGMGDSYRLSGRVADQYRQIGNMVPPLMAQAVAGAVMGMLTGAHEETALPVTAAMPITVGPHHNSSRITKTNNTEGERTMKTMKAKKMTDEEVQEIAKTYVARFNTKGEGNMRTQLELGRLVDDYVHKVTNGGRTRKDAYKILQSMPECAHQTSQLRNYRNAFHLYNELGGDSLFKTTSLSLTHFIVLLPARITNDKKKELLSKAASEHLTVAATRELIPPSQTKPATNPGRQVIEKRIHDFSHWITGMFTAVQEGRTTLAGEDIEKLETLGVLIDNGIEVCRTALPQQELPLAA